MLTKKHDCIEIDGGYVVVDKEAKVKNGEWYLFQFGNLKQLYNCCTEDSKYYSKVIASISKKIKGVPLIETPDKPCYLALAYNEVDLRKAFNAGRMDEGINNRMTYPTTDSYIKSLQKVPISVELEYEKTNIFQEADENWSEGMRTVTQLKVNPDNTITPIKINYEK